MTQRIAIMGGMDWVDASVAFVNIAEHVYIDDAYAEYKAFAEERRSAQRAWYERNPDWVKNKPENDPHPPSVSFEEWLKEQDYASESDVIEWWEPRY